MIYGNCINSTISLPWRITLWMILQFISCSKHFNIGSAFTHATAVINIANFQIRSFAYQPQSVVIKSICWLIVMRRVHECSIENDRYCGAHFWDGVFIEPCMPRRSLSWPCLPLGRLLRTAPVERQNPASSWIHLSGGAASNQITRTKSTSFKWEVLLRLSIGAKLLREKWFQLVYIVNIC